MFRLKGVLSLGIGAIALMASHAAAVPSVTGTVAGPDGTFTIDLSFLNSSTAGEEIASLVLNGGTATAFPLVWDSVGVIASPTGATTIVVGEDTQILTLTFGGDGWDPGETLSLLGMDPDPVGDANGGVTAGQLAGVTATFTFTGGVVQSFQFVDDPAPNAGLSLRPVNVVPEPASAMLGLMGVAGLMLRRRRLA